jgi:hypothetical protein
VLTLDGPLLAVRGDRFVLRDQAATRTLGGGEVLEAVPFPRSLSRAKRIALLEAMALATPRLALEHLLDRLTEGIEAEWFTRGWNLDRERLAPIVNALGLLEVTLADGERLLVLERTWLSLQQQLLESIAKHHVETPEQTGILEAQVSRALRSPPPPRLLRAACDALVRAGSLQRLNAILMTALTSAFGTLPLALAFGAGNEILQPLAIVVLGGLITSTLLTLMVLPALYARFGRWLLPRAISEA